ncbi:hypothetical protein NPIL_156411 [Nephila pilipes]|uniref:Uncharacterized protein n=1 Tax=Nephila pilipes TaxID=299642 RepID=A0A8X6UQ42_NEPPI|nr:hypothetical protein NPIL_156411 [Nephila pilipes]
MTISDDSIDIADKEPDILNHIITGDEMWCYLFDIQSKRASSTGKLPCSKRSKIFRQNWRKGKVMMEGEKGFIQNKDIVLSFQAYFNEFCEKKVDTFTGRNMILNSLNLNLKEIPL